jgi:hypothetical protein
MYEVDKRDRVIELEGVPPSCPGAPLPLVVADEHHVLLAYIVSVPNPNGDGKSTRVVSPLSPDEPIAIVRFERPSAHFFGPPNDEAFAGHPLARRGLHPYGAFEVIESSWIRRLERLNSVHPRHRRDWYLEGKRHLIFTFHDSTFECIVRGYAIERMWGSLDSALERMRDLLAEQWE